MKKIVSLIILISILFSFSVVRADFLSDNGARVLSFALYKENDKILSSDDGGIYPIGSVSKTFTATLVILLSKDGLIDLETPYINYVPEFSLNDERYKDITIRMLLNHTSGLFGSTLKNTMLYGEKSTWNHDNFLSLIKGQRLKSTPGEIASYSNDGYTLLEILLEKVTNKSFTVLLNERLGEFSVKSALELENPMDDMVNSLGSGGLYGNADNLCLFGNNLENIMGKEAFFEMTEVRSDAMPLETYGFGFDNVNAYPFGKYNIKAITKGGDTLNHHTSLVILPELGISAAFIIKGGSSVFAEAEAIKLIKKYLAEEKIAEIDFYGFEMPEKTNEVPIEELKKYEGLYIANNAQYLFSLEENVGVLKNLYTGQSSRLKYLGNGLFDAVNGTISFYTSKGETYITHHGIALLEEGVRYAYGNYIGVKKESGNEIIPEWQKRQGKVYFILDEVYNSQLYIKGISSTNVFFTKNAPEFLGYMKIQSPSYAMADIALPGIYGRDLTDLEIFSKNGKEYAKAQEWTFLDASSITDIYSGKNSVCTILPDGYARWFKAGDAGGKKIEANKSDEGMFALYNERGICTYSSLTEEGENIIPENGYIVFAGNIGTVFNIILN